MGKVAGKVCPSQKVFRDKRYLAEVLPVPNGKIRHEGSEYVSFSSNDYLALSSHPGVIDAVKQALSLGIGTGASRLMAGSTTSHHLLEDKVAEFKSKPAALVFNSGYQANVGIIPSLVSRGDCVFSDRFNHASIVDGIMLSGARCFRFRHNDAGHLEELVRKNRKDHKKALIVTESVFSMDGDAAPLDSIVKIKRSNDCLMMVDEAHATGILGPGGSGLVCGEGLSRDVDIIMGTFSKALGVFGAYAAMDIPLKELLINRCRSFIYSTALPASVVAGCSAAIDIAREESWRRKDLIYKACFFREKMGGLLRDLNESVLSQAVSGGPETIYGASLVSGSSQIVPVVLRESSAALRISTALREKGWWVTAVRPPTVPPGTARLRVSVTTRHDIGTLERFAGDIADSIEKEAKK